MNTQTKHKIHVKDQYCAGPNCDCGYKVKHTPGPWTRSTFRPLEQRRPTPKTIYAGNGVDSERICTVNAITNKETTEANARLIASAPELLEACKATLEAIQGSNDMLERKIKQAIAKAEGNI